jgi:hypothetical protein
VFEHRRNLALLLVLSALLCGIALADAAEFIDPMRPITKGRLKSAPEQTTYVVTAIFVSADRRVAVINGHSAAVGERVDGAWIRRIEPHAVYLERNGRSLAVALTSNLRAPRRASGPGDS